MSALEGFVIQLSNNVFKGVVRYTALLAFIQQALEPFKLAFRFFKQAQPGTHHLARRAVAAIFNLCGYKLVKVGGASVILVFLAMGCLLYQILVYSAKTPITRQGRPTR